MKLLKAMLMMVVGVIILLHTLIPHEHLDRAHEGVTLYAHKCEANLFTDIRITFGLDYGKGHLEHFLELDDLDNDALQSFELLYNLVMPASEELRTLASLESNSGHFRLKPLRGPPMV